MIFEITYTVPSYGPDYEATVVTNGDNEEEVVKQWSKYCAESGHEIIVVKVEVI